MLAVFDQGTGSPCPKPFNMAAYVLAQAEYVPDKTALSIISTEGVENWDYRQLRTAVLGTATGLLQTGLNPGDRLLLRLGNTVDFPVVYLAAISVGVIPVPTSSQLSVPEISQIFAQLSPAMIVADTGISLPENCDVPIIFQNSLREMRELPLADPIQGDPNRAAYIFFTSGTSGRARGVVHAHRAVWARRMMWQGWYGLSSDDRLLHAGAFNWTYTLGTGLMDPWAIGATALIPASGTVVADIPGILAKHKVTIFAAAPGIYRQMLRSDIPALPDLRHGLSAGEKLPDATR
ncbi:MAG: class I adenylate-forming enzyme family protein, partial [Paracoccaceae bacterium]